jgi:hypothetical protein
MHRSNAAIDSRARSHAEENEIMVARAAQVSAVFNRILLVVVCVCACVLGRSKQGAKNHLVEESKDSNIYRW